MTDMFFPVKFGSIWPLNKIYAEFDSKVRGSSKRSSIGGSGGAGARRRPRARKVQPLVEWSEKEVWAYIHAFGVPYNELHDLGYPSSGRAPCTRAITVGEDGRTGLGWWEDPGSKKCGLYVCKIG